MSDIADCSVCDAQRQTATAIRAFHFQSISFMHDHKHLHYINTVKKANAPAFPRRSSQIPDRFVLLPLNGRFSSAGRTIVRSVQKFSKTGCWGILTFKNN